MPPKWNRRSFLAAVGSATSVALLHQRLVDPAKTRPARPTTRIVGVGCAGCDTINYLVEAGMQASAFLAVNSSERILESCRAESKIRIGRRLLNGLSAGARPEVGRRAALENLSDITRAVDGGGLVIVMGGLGGGTGSGAMPVVAQQARSAGATVVSVAAMPAEAEGRKRRRQAEAALAELQCVSDRMATVPFPNCRWVLWPVVQLMATGLMANAILDAQSAWVAEGPDHMTVAT